MVPTGSLLPGRGRDGGVALRGRHPAQTAPSPSRLNIPSPSATHRSLSRLLITDQVRHPSSPFDKHLLCARDASRPQRHRGEDNTVPALMELEGGRHKHLNS